jgi:hypothetical protein
LDALDARSATRISSDVYRYSRDYTRFVRNLEFFWQSCAEAAKNNITIHAQNGIPWATHSHIRDVSRPSGKYSFIRGLNVHRKKLMQGCPPGHSLVYRWF